MFQFFINLYGNTGDGGTDLLKYQVLLKAAKNAGAIYLGEQDDLADAKTFAEGVFDSIDPSSITWTDGDQDSTSNVFDLDITV